MGNINKIVGDRIKYLRKAQMLTQEELAVKASLSYKYIGEVERGTVSPRLDSLNKISIGLGAEVGDLFPRKDDFESIFSSQDLQIVKKAAKLITKALK
jgi:transcriptional regulator with XRE-family HTH domain